MRACGLYLKAATSPNPFEQQSRVLAQTMLELSPPMSLFCSAASWSESPSASFVLAPEHSLRIDPTGATVRYKADERRTNMMMGGPGFVFLPIRLIQLDVSRPIEVRRHFVQFLIWWREPTSDPPIWNLGWMLNEVVGLDFVPIPGEKSLTTVAGPQPPARFDADSAVRVRLNANGEAEWAIVTGPNPRSGVIPLKEPR
jgi:hypothetical protein